LLEVVYFYQGGITLEYLENNTLSYFLKIEKQAIKIQERQNQMLKK
jgi:hypothetical protein